MKSGIFFYIKDVRKNKTWKANYDYLDKNTSKYEVTFSEDKAKFVKVKESIEAETKIVVAEKPGVEIRSIKLKNNSDKEEKLEVISIFEPVLSKMEDDIAHPAFNNLFLKYSMTENQDLILKRNKRGNNKEIYLGTNLFVENDKGGELEYEIDSMKAYKMIENGTSFSNELGLVTDPCVALKRKVILKENEEITLNLIISVSTNMQEVIENLKYYKIQENVNREFNIARAKAEEEARYLSLSSRDLVTFQTLTSYVIFQNPMKSVYLPAISKKKYKQSDFWKYGISGDLPIMLVLIKSVSDVYLVKEMLKAHEYLRIKGIKTDLVILDYEKNVYEQYVKEQIIQEILNMQIGYLQNVSGGVFLLNKNEIEDEDLFKIRANIIIPANKANVYEAIKDMEDEYKSKEKNIGNEKTKDISVPEFEKIKPNIDIQKLRYFNNVRRLFRRWQRIYN